VGVGNRNRIPGRPDQHITDYIFAFYDYAFVSAVQDNLILTILTCTILESNKYSCIMYIAYMKFKCIYLEKKHNKMIKVMDCSPKYNVLNQKLHNHK
jgi:hypothetical protein